MPWVSRREKAETAAAMTRLRDRVRGLEADLLEQGRVNGRLAARTAAAETSAADVHAALRSAHRGQQDENARLREQVERIRRDRDGLRRQLDDALGYSPEDVKRISEGVAQR
ncbi:hypothetical protein ACPC54_23955 [Kitasatospora sp. NPDC094028]